MPFTPSHAVVAIPFARTPLVPAAVAVGAMTPDLPLFVRGTALTYQLTHTSPLLTAAVAAVLLGMWWLLLRPAVRELSPDAVARRLPGEWDAGGAAALLAARGSHRSGAFAILVAVSLLVGVVTHVVWDAFTHEGRWGLALLPMLEADWGPLPGYKWLQHGSSVIALTIIAVWMLVWLRRRDADTAPVVRVLPGWMGPVWWLALPVLLLAAWVIGLVQYGPLTTAWTAQHLAYRVLPPACAVWGALTVVLCAVIVWRRRRRVVAS